MPVLNAEELLHLGLHATNHNDPDKALEYLKRCLDLEPANAGAMYLLGANYAQIGMYDRAQEVLQQSIDLQPTQYTAVFQLGLLHLTRGNPDAARDVWSGLDALGDEHFLYLFKSALLALADDDFFSCLDLIDRGLAANTANEALNNDMRNVRLQAAELLEGGAGPVDEAAVNHFKLSGYHQTENKKR